MDKSEMLARVQLYRSKGIGPQRFWRLIERYGTAMKAPVTALPHGLCPSDISQAELAASEKLGAHFLSADAPSVQGRLALLPDRPAYLWAKGDLSLLDRPAIAIIGARNASSLGRRMAQSLARDLSQRGYAILSGLARGIDAAAHEGALEGGTIAILGTGLAQSYPPENAKLQTAIAQKGLLLSEYAPQVGPLAHHFPARNRIVAALAEAVIVVEAAEGSGSLLTVRDALDLGREVMAVPGHPFDPRAGGCNRMLREGALLVRSAEDVIEALTPFTLPQAKPSAPPPASPFEGDLLGLISLTPSPLEDLRLALKLNPSDFATRISEAELSGEILILPGGLIARNPEN